MVWKYTQIFSFRKYTFSTNSPLILLMSPIFFAKNLHLEMVQLLKAVVQDFLVLFKGSIRYKVTINENVTFIDHVSGIRLPDSCKFLVNQKKRQWRYNLSTWGHRRFFFWRWCVSLTKFSYWSKFHVNIMTGSGVMRTFFYKGLSINQETKNTLSYFWSISGDWGELEIR